MLPARIASVWSLLPLPLRLGLVALACFAAASVVRQAGWWLVGGATLLWLVVILGVLHRLGMAAALTGSPVARPFFTWLLGAAAPAAARQPPQPSADPQLATRAASHTINALYGVDDAKRGIEKLLALASAAKGRGQGGFGTGMPAVVIVLSGPSGTGKTTVARALAELLFGQGVIARPEIVELHAQIAAAHQTEVAGRAEERAGQSAGGLLLVDDAEWLFVSNQGVAPAGREVGVGVLRAASRQPGQITLVLTGGPALGAMLAASLDQAGWLNKLHHIRIDFDSLPEPDLSAIFSRTLVQENAALDPVAKESLASLVTAELRAGGDHFANAITMQRLAARAIEVAAHRLQDEGWTGGRMTITARDIRCLSAT